MTEKQSQIPGTEDPNIPELDELACAYEEKRDLRMVLLKKERELKERLARMMQQHQFASYRVPGTNIVVMFEHESNLKVKRIKLRDDESPAE